MRLKVRNLAVEFGTVRALRGVSLAAEPGEVVAVFGTNGSGKTTFLKAIAGLIPISGGRIICEGEDVTLLPSHERVARGVSYVSERARVAPGMTVRENLDAGAWLRPPREWEEARERVHGLFPVLRETEARKAGTLSGGERQMLVIGRGLMGSPSLLLLDEPFLGLSLSLRDRILDVIASSLRGKVTILLAEHDVEAALRVADRYCVFLNGEILHAGPRSEVPDGARLTAAFRRFYQMGKGEKP